MYICIYITGALLPEPLVDFVKKNAMAVMHISPQVELVNSLYTNIRARKFGDCLSI